MQLSKECERRSKFENKSLKKDNLLIFLLLATRRQEWNNLEKERSNTCSNKLNEFKKDGIKITQWQKK